MTEVATKPARVRPARTGPPRRTPPRRVSGPARRPGRAREPRRSPLSERLGAFVRALPDHALLDRLVRGRAWIPLLGVMLGGIVALQVELLKLNAATGRSIELVSALQSRNEILRAEVATDSAPGRIERLGLRMGMMLPGPEAITFVRAGSASARRAAASMHPPNVAAFEAALQATNTATAGSTPLLAPPSNPTPAPTPSTTAPSTTTTSTASGTRSTATASTAAPPAMVP
jgi:hypothetical protein